MTAKKAVITFAIKRDSPMVDKLIQSIKTGFKQVSEHRYKNASIHLDDFLQSAFAMFHLKDPSVHQYRLNYPERADNLERIYKINFLPSDSAMREGIDGVNPNDIQECFKIPLAELSKQGIIDEYQVLNQYQAILFDGTQHYCSAKTPCEHCLKKVYRNKKGEITKITYSHQALAAVMAHPDSKEVFPIACEAIIKQDGSEKNDCELNASKRLIPTVRRMLPVEQYKLIGVFDGLYPNGPHIKMLNEYQMHYIIGIQDGYVLIQIDALKAKNALQTREWITTNGNKGIARWANGLILNGQHQEISTNYFEYEELDAAGNRIYFNSWITDIPIVQQNIEELVQIGRSRWKIENETFNTLKNQGYNLEHSYGHGKKYLATNFMMLTFLAFLVDQTSQKIDTAFNKAWEYCKTKKRLWEKIRQVFDLIPCMSMNVVYRFIAREIKIDFPLLE